MTMKIYIYIYIFFNRRILLHGKNSQKRDNIKKKDNKTTKTKSIYTVIFAQNYNT